MKMDENEETSIEIVEDDRKTEEITEKEETKADVVSVEYLFRDDITFRDLPDAVKEAFQQYLNRIPKNVASYKSDIEIIQGLKNICMSGYLRDILFEHIIKVKESFKDKENPEEWARQINPSLFTKIEKFIATNRSEVEKTFDNAGMDEDFDKFESVTMTRIMKEQKMIKKKKDSPKTKVLDGEYEVVK
jgi:hypothetical protein